jgi:hypothetical protein
MDAILARRRSRNRIIPLLDEAIVDTIKIG